MAFVCIPKSKADAFKRALKGKDIQIADLLKMSTEERTKLFEQFAGKDAGSMNKLFEEKLVLKNKVLGLKNFIKKVGQEGRYDPAQKAKLEQMASDFRAQQQERIFNPKEEEAFLNDLADTATGVHITRAEAANVFKLSTEVENLKKEFDGEKWSSPKAAADYGASKVALENYTDALKAGDQSVKALVKGTLSDFKDTFSENKPKAVADLLLKTVKTISDNSISLVASVDNSFMGRQGLKTLMTHPTVWWKGARQSFVDIAKTMGGKNMKDALMAEIYSKPNYINGEYEQAGLLPKTEEQYPTSLPARMWGVGRVFKASEVAFEGSALRMRTGLYDLVKDIARKNEVEWDDKQIESVGKMVSSLTARGQFGERGQGIIRLVLWAPKMLRANFDVLTAHTGQDMTSFARMEAVKNLGKIVATSAAVVMIANAIKPGSAETDPRSTNFGKIKVGNTTFDYTGGAGSLVVLGARLGYVMANQPAYKNSNGILERLNTGQYGSKTAFDVITDFLVNKTTPPLGALIALARGSLPNGQTATPQAVIENATTPITIQNMLQLKSDSSASAIAGVLLDTIGINANTFVPSKDWNQAPGVELTAFKAKVGDQKFQQANTDYNKQYNAWFSQVKTDPKYTSLADADKQKVITNKKTALKTAIFKQYGFTYKKAKPTKLPKV